MANGYVSRKFIITTLVVLLTAGLAFVGKMDANVAFVFAAGITAYNWANVQKAKQATPDF